MTSEPVKPNIIHAIVVIALCLLIPIALLIGGQAAQAETAVVVTHDDASSTIGWSGSWGTGSSPYAMAQTLHWSNVQGNASTYGFYGSRISYFYSMAFNRGKTFVYIDDVLIDQVDAYSSETRRQIGKTWNVTPGFHTIKVVVGGGGPSGNYSDVDAFAVDIANVGTGVYDNTHSHIRYFGNWSDSSYTVGSYNDSVKVTNSPESGFRFTFTGDEITYIYSTSSNRGVAAVTIDGINKGLINQFSSDNRRQIGKTYSGLGSGVHIMNVVLTGTSQAYIDLDALVVGNVYNRAAAVAYADAWAHGRNADYPNYGTGDSCNDCTNYVSQVLEAGGMPRIADPTRDDELFWYVWTDMLGRLRGSKSWAATDWFKAHLDAFPYRYQLVGTSSRASVETLTEGDVIVMNLFFNEFNGPDHASVIMGWGSPMEPQGDTVWSQLRNAHCRDRQRVRWDLNLIPEDIYWAYKVVY